jgi:hypothetical protein
MVSILNLIYREFLNSAVPGMAVWEAGDDD